jgi:hypothetical protein
MKDEDVLRPTVVPKVLEVVALVKKLGSLVIVVDNWSEKGLATRNGVLETHLSIEAVTGLLPVF